MRGLGGRDGAHGAGELGAGQEHGAAALIALDADVDSGAEDGPAIGPTSVGLAHLDPVAEVDCERLFHELTLRRLGVGLLP